MNAYKYEIGQSAVDTDIREGVITYRYRSMDVNKYVLKDSKGDSFTRRESDLFGVPIPKPKYERGDWVTRRYCTGYVEDSYTNGGSKFLYTIYVPGTGVRSGITEESLTKIEHGFRPGDRVTFSGWAANFGNYTVTGEITKLTSKTGLDIRDDKSGGIYGRSSQNVVKLEKPIKKPINLYDLPMPPKFDTLKSYTLTTTISDPDPELVKLLTGMDVISAGKITVPTKRIKEAREALDKQIKDAEAELKKLKDARAKL